MTQADAALEILKALYATVLDAGPAGAPRGALYLAFAENGVSLQTYEKIENLLVRTGTVKRVGQTLVALR